ncbi:hypothetical protein ACIRFH_08600 [Streptomyces sp. NPDC093586]|uniref:hypothetical protein n=1 Tax=Streptomyces sp. NPDC093586 TaxID=3366042 RepID=UPI003810D452
MDGAALPGFPPSVRRTGAVHSRVPDRVADRLLAVPRRALAAASHGHGVSRAEVLVDAAASLPDGRDAVGGAAVSHDGTPEETAPGEDSGGTAPADGTRTTATRRPPLRAGAGPCPATPLPVHGPVTPRGRVYSRRTAGRRTSRRGPGDVASVVGDR